MCTRSLCVVVTRGAQLFGNNKKMHEAAGKCHEYKLSRVCGAVAVPYTITYFACRYIHHIINVLAGGMAGGQCTTRALLAFFVCWFGTFSLYDLHMT